MAESFSHEKFDLKSLEIKSEGLGDGYDLRRWTDAIGLFDDRK